MRALNYPRIQDYSSQGKEVDWSLAVTALRQTLEEQGTARSTLLRDLQVQTDALAHDAQHYHAATLYLALHRLQRVIREELERPSENTSKISRLIAYIERLARQGINCDEPVTTHQALVITQEPLPDYISNTLIRAGFNPMIHALGLETAPTVDDNISVVLRYAGPKTPHDAIVTPLQQIRDLRTDIPRMLITPCDDFHTRLAALRANVQHFLPEPVDIRRLNDILTTLGLAEEDNRPYRVLMIDDMETTGIYWRRHLEEAGDMEFHFEQNPEAGFNAALSFNPDVILLDLYMPGIAGTELARMFRDMETLRDVPILYMSVEDGAERRFEARLQGGDDFLDKDIDHNDLLRMIRYRARRYRQIRNQIRTDGLTGLLNHVAIRELLAEELDRAGRFKHETAVIMLDIDNFKRVNDDYGHQAGDTVIRGLANLLNTRLRRYDGLGRYGGEEFMIILPNTSPAHAAKLVNRLRKEFAQMPHHLGDRVLYASFSAGVATCATSCEISELIEAADAALYKAKDAGRNCVRLFNARTAAVA